MLKFLYRQRNFSLYYHLYMDIKNLVPALYSYFQLIHKQTLFFPEEYNFVCIVLHSTYLQCGSMLPSTKYQKVGYTI
jgi:hypothetical protein